MTSQHSRFRWMDFNAVGGLRMAVAAFSILCGLTGVLAGVLEISQGDVETGGIVISTIESANGLSGTLTYLAFTVLPNMLVTGVAAIVVSVAAMVWAVGFVQRDNGPLVLLGLFVAQTLLGGGWILDLALITVILATRIGKPLNWWRSHLPSGAQDWLSRVLLPSLVAYAVISFCLLALTVASIEDSSLAVQMEYLATIMFVPMVLLILGAIAHDIRRNPLT